MDVVSIFPIALPIVLFVITLIIIFALRSSDQNSRNLSNVKKLVEQYGAQVESADSNFKQELAEIEIQIGKREDQLHSLIQTCTTQISTLDSYYDDFSKLGSAMQTYKTALAGLQKLTDRTRADVDMVNEDVGRLEEVRNVIEGFRMDLEEASKQLVEQEKTVITLERDTLEHLRAAASAADADMDSALENLRQEVSQIIQVFRSDMGMLVEGHTGQVEGMLDRMTASVQGYIAELDAKSKATHEAADTLNERSLAILNNMGDRTQDQILLSQQVADLAEKKAVLEQQLSSLDAQIKEKVQVAAEMNEMTEIESRRLEDVRSDLERLEDQISESRFEIRNMDFDLDDEPAPEPVSEPVPEPVSEPVSENTEKKSTVEYTGEDEEVIFN